MTCCTGMLGKLCSCGMWHGDGGRAVNTHTDEAPRPRFPFAPGAIEGPDDESDFLKQDNALTAGLRWFGIPALIALCIAFAVLAVYFRPT